MRSHYDIVIAGGGMVGASLALALCRALGAGVRVLVVESFALPDRLEQASFQPSFDARSTALAAGSRQIYEAIGIWDQLQAGLCSIDTIHVSTRGRPGSTLLSAEGEPIPALGYVVENHWLGRVLLAHIGHFPQLEWCAPATVETVSPTQSGGSSVLIRQGGEQLQLSCDLLVIADGEGSSLARSLGVAYVETDYGHGAIIANVSTSRGHHGRAFERFTEQGPLALLPLLPEGKKSRSALVWTLPTDLAGEVMQADDASFLARLQDRFGFRLGVFERAGERFHYPLKRVDATEQVRTGVVIMGNAAHFLHPVAGQGFNLALRDVAHLVETLVGARAAGRKPGELQVLQAYRQAQSWDQRKTTLFSDQVSAVFAWSQPLVAVARDISLASLDLVLPAKSWFVKHAGGLAGSGTRW